MGKLNFDLIVKRNLRSNILEEDSDDAAKQVHKLTHIRLDRAEICEINNLDLLGNVTNLYLQHNCITKIENLESLAPTLRFLTLANNKIKKVEGLSLLTKLGFLDICDNQIDSFDAEQLPKSLVFVALEGNDCCKEANYKEKLIASLPKLRSIDGDMLAQEGDSEEESDDDLDDEEFQPGNFDLKNMAASLLDRSVLRLDELIADHKEKISELKESLEPKERGDCDDKPVSTGTLAELEERLKKSLEEMLQADKDGQEIFKSFDIADRPPMPVVTEKGYEPTSNKDYTKSAKANAIKMEKAAKKLNLVSAGTTTSEKTAKKLHLPVISPARKKTPASSKEGLFPSASTSSSLRPNSTDNTRYASSTWRPNSTDNTRYTRPFITKK